MHPHPQYPEPVEPRYAGRHEPVSPENVRQSEDSETQAGLLHVITRLDRMEESMEGSRGAIDGYAPTLKKIKTAATMATLAMLFSLLTLAGVIYLILEH